METSFKSVAGMFQAKLPEDFYGPPKPLVIQLGQVEAKCPAHGLYLSTGTKYTTGKGREVWTPCAGCTRDREVEAKAQAEEEKQQREAEVMQIMLGRAAIPQRFLGRSFDSYIAEEPGQRRALTKTRDYAENFEQHVKTGESLMLLGTKGTGKSHLAAAILQELLPRWVGLYATVADLIEMVRDTWRSDSERSQAQVMKMLTTVPLLVIDEVGVQSGSENEQQILFAIIDRRYRDKRPMILMGNCKADGVQELLGERTYDRMREVAKLVAFEWESYRATARKNT